MASMDLPATYYGKVDKRNPVIVSFERDINSFMTVMKRVASSTCQDNVSYAKGITLLAEIWRNFKPRLPFKLYQERMLQIGDFLTGLKLYQTALSQGYSLHLLQFCSTSITDITDVNHFISCFFPEGFDTDQDVFIMKVRSMLGCAQCIFELEKRPMVLSQKGLSKLLHVLNFIRIMMQAFQQNKHLCWIIYNGTLHIFKMCSYLMALNHSAKALEYLLWASLTLESTMPSMTIKHLPWLVKLYCAVCHCYYDNLSSLRAEEFARRALGKINDLAEQEKDKENSHPSNKETQMAFREASIKLAAIMFKRAVFETRRKPKHIITIKSKITLKDFPNIPWPRNATERMLMGLFDSSASQFLGICEALWDSSMRPLQARLPEELELQDVVLELFASGISILSGAATTTDQKRHEQSCVPLSALSTTSTLMELAVAGEHKVPVSAAVRFIKMMIQYKQPDAFAEYSRLMLQSLSVVEGPAFRKAEYELSLISGFSTLKSCHRRRLRDDGSGGTKRCRGSLDAIIGLTETLHRAVCDSVLEAQPEIELVWHVLLFLWGKLKLAIMMDQLKNPEFTQDHDKWAWCLSMQCEVAFACDLATVDCIKTAEMIHRLVLLLESAAERIPMKIKTGGEKKYTFTLLKGSRIDLLQKVCTVVENGFEALVKRVVTLMPQDGAASPDITYLLRDDGNVKSEISEKQKEEIESDAKRNRSNQSTHTAMLAIDILLELDIIHHRASLKLMQLNAVTESDILDKIKKNKVSKALFLIQKALLINDGCQSNDSCVTRSLLEEACILIDKAAIEERKLYIANNPKFALENKGKILKEEKETPPPRPVLISRTYCSLTFAPAPYHMEEQVCWYQLWGRAAEGIDLKVRFGDCSLAGTGNLVPAICGEWQLKADKLVPNQKYVFAIAAYTCQGKLLGNAIGATTFPLLTSMPKSLLSSWAHLAQVAFQTNQFDIAKKACKELWCHFTLPDKGPHKTQDRLGSTALHMKYLQCSSPLLCQLFLTSIFIETDINIQQQSLQCDSGSICGLFVWKQEARLAECGRLLVAMDLAMWLNDSSSAVQAVISCYGLLVPFIFHQIPCDPAIKLLTKCLNVLKENEAHLKQKWSRNTVETLMHMIACITNYLSKALRALKEHHKASVVIECGRALLHDIFEAQERLIRLACKRFSTKTEDPAAVREEMKKCVKLKAHYMKFKEVITAEEDPDIVKESSPSLSGSEDVATLRERIITGTLQHAYRIVMQLGSHSNFMEISSLLLQRALEEGDPDHVVQWGQTIFGFLARRDDEMIMPTKYTERNTQYSDKEAESCSTESQTSQKTTKMTKKRKKLRRGALLTARTVRELKAVERLLTCMNSVVERHNRRLQLRKRCSEERVWRCQINYSIALAHLTLFGQSLQPLYEASLQPRYSHLNPSLFFLANSGVMVKKNLEEQLTAICKVSSESDSSRTDLSDDASSKECDKNDAEMKRSQFLVCVPLDVTNTLHFYRQAIERIPHCLQVFRYSRALLLLLLAHTQPCFETEQFGEIKSDQIDFNPMLMTTPSIQPWDLINKDYITPDTLYNPPISSECTSRIISTYFESTKYLQTNNQESLSVFALHELGNLHFYDLNTRMAHTCWSKAIDAALHSSGVIDKWDWVSFGGGTLQQTLKQVGIWGCMQAAVITAKIAQYILTSDISQRTKLCLLSAHLFKCVLRCSLAHPLEDLLYASYSIGDELLPGVDLFSEPHRADLSTTVASLNFICQWLFIAGYYIELLPMLTLYQHIVGTVCRDVQRNVESRIIKIRAFTELYFFSEAIKETEQLSRGAGILLPNGRYIARESQQSEKLFCDSKSLLDNVQALEALLCCELSPEVSMLYGSSLEQRFNLARVQLCLALSSTVNGHPEPVTDDEVDLEENEEEEMDSEDVEEVKEKPKVNEFTSHQTLTLEKIKYLLLKAAALFLDSILEKLPSPSYSEIENMELKIEANLLKANLYLQQGHVAQSSEMAVSSLLLLQDFKETILDFQKPSFELMLAESESDQETEQCVQHGDCPRAIEASERVGGALWLRCRVALLRCVLLQASDVTAPNPGKLHDKAALVLKQSLEDCAALGDVDTQALLLVEGSQLKSRRKRGDDGLSLLQEAVSLLSGRTRMPPGSSMTLIRATMRLTSLKSTQSGKLLNLTHKLLQKQLCELGENVLLEDGKCSISPPGPKNIYLPYLQMLDQTS
ncbi:cilia- and flagella-associated protein 54-like isoform X9 [Corythoichthys intestinalis]|uniref:cilia- and flagella-associated protein 54-like isoform X9 n=1 Tax=Corythoichthys intestinalis TaxID=161448 RepID=UPI0025A63BE3|nr:cilia- and flagella-associated protein 54-like isoform X9 [Corythoichthys intestinalis]